MCCNFYSMKSFGITLIQTKLLLEKNCDKVFYSVKWRAHRHNTFLKQSMCSGLLAYDISSIAVLKILFTLSQ